MTFENDSSDDVSFEGEVGRQSSEDNVSRMNTEDSLLSSKASSVSIHKSGDVACCAEADIERKCCNPKSKIFIGTLLSIWGVCTLIWTPFDVCMSERLRMRPGFPPYDWWKSPPDEVLLKVFIFNITNAQKFLSGEDAKLNMQEIGPIIFREKLIHTNITFNDNGTLTYVAIRKAIFLPEENSIDLNQTITVPNVPVLGMASYFWDASFFEKIGFNIMMSTSNSNVTVDITIYNYLWNFTDPIMELGKKIAPKMVPVNNLGILARIYEDFTDTVTVFIGTEHGNDKYFRIDKYDGSEHLPGHGEKCEDKVVDSTEGVAYPQLLNKSAEIKYWRKTMCLVTSLFFDYAEDMYGVEAFRYTLANNTYDRTRPEEKDCYKSDPVLPDGLADVSQCFWDFPIATSFPHFLYGDPKLRGFVDGLEPEVSKHESYVFIEPTTGIPINSHARSQSNLIMRELDGFNDDIERFSELVVPMFWAEYNQVGLPWYIVSLIYFTVKILPVFQIVWTAHLFLAATLLITSGIKERIHSKRKKYLTKNKVLQYEQEVFLKA